MYKRQHTASKDNVLCLLSSRLTKTFNVRTCVANIKRRYVRVVLCTCIHDSELLLESVYIMKVVDLIFMNLMSIVTLTACHLTCFHSMEILAF